MKPEEFLGAGAFDFSSIGQDIDFIAIISEEALLVADIYKEKDKDTYIAILDLVSHMQALPAKIEALGEAGQLVWMNVFSKIMAKIMQPGNVKSLL